MIDPGKEVDKNLVDYEVLICVFLLYLLLMCHVPSVTG